MKSLLKLTAIILSILAGLWLCTKILPLISPFLFSVGAAVIVEPAVSRLCRHGVKRSLAAGIMTVISLVVPLSLLAVITMGSTHLLGSYAKQTPQILYTLTEAVTDIQQLLPNILGTLPDSIPHNILPSPGTVSAKLSELPIKLSERALGAMAAFAKRSPDGILFLCTAVIGVYFFSAYYDEVLAFFRRQLPAELRHKLSLIRQVTINTVTSYLKVQCIISGVTFLVLLAAFRVMGIRSIFSAAAAIAIVDALPILGAGAVLLPWSLIALLLGNASRAISLLLVYGLLVVLHNLLQAKLMGSRLGLHPVTALVSLYVGWKLGGLGGMLVLPIVCVLLSTFNNAGIIQIYR